MGYRAEKLKTENKVKILKHVLLGILLFILLCLCIFSMFFPPSTWKYNVALPKIDKRKDGEMRIHFIDVGQGDSTLIELPDGKHMLIDGGNGSAASTKSLLRYLNALKIDQIDHLVVSHADGDHCGGLKAILSEVKVFNAYLPPSFSSEDVKYAEFYAALNKTNCEVIHSSRALANIGSSAEGIEDGYTLSFLSPKTLTVEEVISGEMEVTDDNVLSAVIWLDYQGVSTLFMGDAPKKIEEDLFRDYDLGLFKKRGVDLASTEILKVSHHGSDSATSLEFLQRLNVKEGIISCGKGNDYGHPHSSVLTRLTSVGANIHRTDEDGHICITVSKDGLYKVKKISS